MPSWVSCVSLPVVMSRTHKLKSRINAARLASGERTLFGGSGTPSDVTHLAPCTSHLQLRLAALKVMLRPSSWNLKVLNGRRPGSYFVPEAADKACATLA